LRAAANHGVDRRAAEQDVLHTATDRNSDRGCAARCDLLRTAAENRLTAAGRAVGQHLLAAATDMRTEIYAIVGLHVAAADGYAARRAPLLNDLATTIVDRRTDRDAAARDIFRTPAEKRADGGASKIDGFRATGEDRGAARSATAIDREGPEIVNLSAACEAVSDLGAAAADRGRGVAGRPSCRSPGQNSPANREAGHGFTVPLAVPPLRTINEAGKLLIVMPEEVIALPCKVVPIASPPL
jgi:hypothetical protein